MRREPDDATNTTGMLVREGSSSDADSSGDSTSADYGNTSASPGTPKARLVNFEDIGHRFSAVDCS
jgi:hypothetical protein